MNNHYSVSILRRVRGDPPIENGLNRVSDLIERSLRETDVPFNDIYYKMDMKNGFFKCIKYGFFKPFMDVLESDKSDIYHFTDELCGLSSPLIRGKKIVHVHHVIKSGECSWKWRFFWTAMTMITLFNSDRIIAISSSTKRDLMESFFVPGSKITVINSCADPSFDRKPHLKESKTIGYMGEMIPRKNYDLLIDVFSKLRKKDGMQDCRLLICGKGPLFNEITKKIRLMGLQDCIEIVSNLDNDSLVDFYNRITVLANTTRHEGLGMAILEAQMCGTPVVCMKNADIPDEVAEKVIRTDTEEEYVDTLYRLLTDKKYYSTIADDAYSYAHAFGKDFSEKLLDTYKSVLNEPKEGV